MIMHLVAFVCAVLVVTVESLRLETSFQVTRVHHLRDVLVIFVYRGHRVKAKVT